MDEKWYRRESDGLIVPSSSWISSYTPKGFAFYKWLTNRKDWDEAEHIRSVRGDLGSRVHRAINLMVTRKIEDDPTPIHMEDEFVSDLTEDTKALNVEEWECLMSFKNWCDKAQPRFIDTERTRFNEEMGYAGTRDIRAYIESGRAAWLQNQTRKEPILKTPEETWTIDVKTSQDIWLDHETQMNSYGMFEDSLGDRLAILQVGYRKNQRLWKFTEIERRPELFSSAYSFWKFNNPDAKPKQRTYPTALSLINYH
jgi:hypothetical protein